MRKASAKTGTVTLAQVEDTLITIRGQSVLLDSDVAALYAVETKEINQAVKNNPDKFPEGYVIQLDKAEWQNLRSKFVTLSEKELVTNCDKSNSRSKILILEADKEVTNCDLLDGQNLRSKNLTLRKGEWGQHPKYPPKAFTEKGLYMLATILKGKRAAQTTIAIVETYSKIRELARTVARLAETKEKFTQQSLMQKSGEIMADVLGEGMKTTDTETSFELNLAVLKFKHTVKRKPE
ncbi:MAG: ORF6N domain-containing protein [Kiritimatiellaeota bacterium]|nr:ORF6N domain-containing protein [Kiritimatiellota bacterium]